MIKHEKILEDCDAEPKNFLNVTGILGDKLEPRFFPFSYFNKTKFKSVGEFLSRLRPFLTAKEALSELLPFQLLVDVIQKVLIACE